MYIPVYNFVLKFRQITIQPIFKKFQQQQEQHQNPRFSQILKSWLYCIQNDHSTYFPEFRQADF